MGRRAKGPFFAKNANFSYIVLNSFRDVIVCAVCLQCGEENPPAIQMTTIQSEGPEPGHIHSEGPEPDQIYSEGPEPDHNQSEGPELEQFHNEGPEEPKPFPVEVSDQRDSHQLLNSVRCWAPVCGSGSSWAYMDPDLIISVWVLSPIPIRDANKKNTFGRLVSTVL